MNKSAYIGNHYYISPIILAASLASPAIAQSSAPAQQAQVEDIVVTAQKREQNLQVVPIAVTAVSAQSLQAARFENVKDLNAIAPGLSVRENAGGISSPSFSIRGVYGTATYASDSGVALYIDGVYIGSPIGAMFDLANIERIEVLRGPQGTLFGRNAIGGAVNLITKEPSGELHVKQDFTYGNFDQFRSRTFVDLPSFGPLSVSFSYLHDTRRGDVRNLGGGTVWDFGPATGGKYGKRRSPNYLGGHNSDAFAAAIKLEPGAGIKAVYRFDYSDKHHTPEAVGIATFDNTGVDLSAMFKAYWLAQDPATRTPISLTRPDAVNNWFSTVNHLRTQTHSLTLTAPITDNISVKNILAYRKVRQEATNQLDGAGGLVIPVATPYTLIGGTFSPGVLPAGTPILPIENNLLSRQKSFSEELQVNIDTDWFRTTIGFLHYHGFTVEGGLPNVANAPFGSGLVLPVFGGILLSPGYVDFTAPLSAAVPSRAKINSDAIYFQHEFHLTDRLDLQLGARLTRDVRSGTDNSSTPAAPGSPVSYRRSTPTFLAGFNYQLDDDIFTYAKYSTAYISGGRLAGIDFNPDTARSWEAGIKSDLMDHRLRLNLALFTVKYLGVQILSSPTVGCANAPGVNPGATQCIINGGDARAKGFELESTVVPINGLTLGGSLAYTHFKYTRIDPILRAADGTFVPNYNPKWTANLSAQYNGPEIFGTARIQARLDANYTSSQFGGANSNQFIQKLTKIPSTWLANGRIALAGISVGNAEVELAAWARNIFDNKNQTYGANLGAVYAVQYQRSRTFGADLSIQF